MEDLQEQTSGGGGGVGDGTVKERGGAPGEQSQAIQVRIKNKGTGPLRRPL